MFCAVFLSCEEAIEWQSSEEGRLPGLVVDGVFTNERSIQSVRLTKPVEQMSETPVAVSGANVIISDGSNHVHLIESTAEPGNYETESPVRGITGRNYYLRIDWEEHVYWAVDSMVPLSTEKAVFVVPDDSAGWYKLAFQERGNPAMIEVLMQWDHLSDTCMEKEFQARQVFYVLYNVDVNKAFSWNKEKIRFPAGTRVIRKKYSLSPRHQEFARSLLMETDWRGGIFDVLPGNVLTNVSNNGAGFFGACTVLTDTIIAGD